MKKQYLLAVFCILVLFGTLAITPAARAEGQTRTYCIAVDEMDWDYTPAGMDQMMGMPFDKNAKMYAESDKHQIGRVYRKAVYREYTDASFTTLKKRAAEWEHLGILGPAIHAEVGDTIQIFFKNNGTQSYSMHPHGVFYEKSSEGSYYNDGANDPTHNGVIAPGGTHTYIWQVPERSGPGPNDPSSVVWLYHSHNYEGRDTNAGLIGALIITRKGMTVRMERPRTLTASS
jgi:manganese oxidase